MASGMVRSAITTVVEKTPSQSSRSCKLRRWAEEILEKCCQGDAEADEFDSFSSEIMKYFKQMVSTTAARYKLNSTKREHLWRKFHLAQAKGELPELWQRLTSKWNIAIDDRLLEQSLYQELFETSMKEHFTATATVCSADSTVDIVLSVDELNVMRYVGGYVARHILRRYEKSAGEHYHQCITCLGEMAVAGEGEDLLSYTRKWIDKVNRGGLFPINDSSFHLFIEIEKCVRMYLPKHLSKSNSAFKESVHDKVLANEDVQFHWTLLSQDIDNPDDSLAVLTDIVKLWVTLRGFSMVGAWMEVYKSQEGRNTQKSTGLRKSLSGAKQ